MCTFVRGSWRSVAIDLAIAGFEANRVQAEPATGRGIAPAPALSLSRRLFDGSAAVIAIASMPLHIFETC